MTDEESEDYFPHLDGRWSRQTKELLAQHSAGGLDLNRNWALVRKGWFCPCCSRYKRDLVRKAENGILIARLEVHHDHMREAVKRVFTERLGIPRTIPAEALHVENAVVTMVQRFSEELICVDCNTADGLVKSKLVGEIHPDFSFGPAEIGTFITASPNKPHIVNVEKARKIWEAQRADLAARFALVEDVIVRLADGGLRRERTGNELRPAYLALQPNWFLGKAFDEATLNSPHRRWYGLADFIARSTSNQGARLRSSQKPRPAAAAPTDAEFAAIDQTMMASTPWRNAGADWRCASCNRSKREICRKSKSGKWTARIHNSQDYIFEYDPVSIEMRSELYPAFSHDPMIGDYFDYAICQDCASIKSELQAQRPEIGDVYFSLDDLRELAGEVEPNRNHDRDFAKAAARAIENAPIIDAADAFHEHHSLSVSALVYYQLGREQLKDGEARAYASIRLEGQQGWPEGKLDPFIDWLITEGVRLNQHQNKKF
jgi:rubredoxin